MKTSLYGYSRNRSEDIPVSIGRDVSGEKQGASKAGLALCDSGCSWFDIHGECEFRRFAIDCDPKMRNPFARHINLDHTDIGPNIACFFKPSLRAHLHPGHVHVKLEADSVDGLFLSGFRIDDLDTNRISSGNEVRFSPQDCDFVFSDQTG